MLPGYVNGALVGGTLFERMARVIPFSLEAGQASGFVVMAFDCFICFSDGGFL